MTFTTKLLKTPALNLGFTAIFTTKPLEGGLRLLGALLLNFDYFRKIGPVEALHYQTTADVEKSPLGDLGHSRQFL